MIEDVERRTIRLAIKVWLAVAIVAIAVCPAAAQQKLASFRILMPEPHGYTFRAIYIGVEKGWFQAEGLDIGFLPVPGGAVNLVPQLAQGNGELAYAGGYTVIQARARGVPVVAVNAASTESLWGLIARRASQIKKPADLRGKTLGIVAFSSATHFMALGLLKAGGLSEADVNLRPIGMGGPAAISQGQVDGYIWFQTQGLALQTRGAAVDILPLDDIIPLPQDAMIVTETLIKEKSEQIRGFMRALHRAILYDNDPGHESEDDAYQAKYAPESVADKTYLKALNEFARARLARDEAKGWRWGETDPRRLEAAQRFLLDLKVIDQPTPVEKMYDNSFLPDAK